MNPPSLRSRIRNGSLIMLGVAVALGTLALPGIHRLGEAIRKTLHRNYLSIEAAQNMHKALWALQLAQNNGQADQVLKPSWDSFRHWIDVEPHDITEVGEAELARDIEQRGNNLFGAFAARVQDGSIDQDFAGLHSRLDDLIALNSNAMFPVEAHGGRIFVDTTEGYDTCFRVEIPIRQEGLWPDC